MDGVGRVAGGIRSACRASVWMSRVVLAMSGGVDSSVAAHLAQAGGHEVIGLFMRDLGLRRLRTIARPRPVACATDAIGLPGRRRPARHPVSTPSTSSAISHGSWTTSPAKAAAGQTFAPRPATSGSNSASSGPTTGRVGATSSPQDITHRSSTKRRRQRITDRPGHRRGEGITPTSFSGLPSRVSWGTSSCRWEVQPRRRSARSPTIGMAFRSTTSSDSQEICFIPDDDYLSFVRDRRPDRRHFRAESSMRTAPPRAITAGIEGFTIGQRRGLGIAVGALASYVVRIEPVTRTVTVSRRESLDRLPGSKAASGPSRRSTAPGGPLRGLARIRACHRGRAH